MEGRKYATLDFIEHLQYKDKDTVKIIKIPILFFSAERLKRDFDKAFGAPWNVIVGECYSFDIDYDFHFIYYFLYGPVAILAWRVSLFFYFEYCKVASSNVSHLEAHVGFFRWLVKGIFGPYVL